MNNPIVIALIILLVALLARIIYMLPEVIYQVRLYRADRAEAELTALLSRARIKV